MFEPLLLLVAAAFLLAGFIKGVIGLGLPTVSMGLLAVTMQPSHALAIVIVPAIVTNIWQTFVGPYLRDIIRRLWPLMAGTVVGIWLNADMLTGPGLSKFSFRVARSDEKWIGGIVGLITGVVSAATGVQVIPSMPFMQAIGMEKDELVQALGVFFTVATVALAFNLTSAGLLSASTALPGAVAMTAAFAGMFIGQAVRSRMKPEVFRRWFLISMILLGLYLAGSAVYKVLASWPLSSTRRRLSSPSSGRSSTPYPYSAHHLNHADPDILQDACSLVGDAASSRLETQAAIRFPIAECQGLTYVQPCSCSSITRTTPDFTTVASGIRGMSLSSDLRIFS
jgi:uncharacterized membrane protein YfcA